VLRYIIENNKSNSIDMVVSLNITTSTDPVNFNVSYAYTTESADLSTKLSSNKSKFTSTFTPQELKAGSTAYIYVICEIANLELDASFIGTANWVLIDANDYVAPVATLITGKEFAKALKLPGNSSAIYSSSDLTVKKLIFGSYSDYSSAVSTASTTTIVSTSDSDVEAIMYHVGNSTNGYNVYILSDSKISLNVDSGYMFSGCRGLSTLDLSNFDTSSVTDMGSMFSGCIGLSTLDLSNFDTSSVTNMSSMFYGCSGLSTLDLSNFDTSNVTDMGGMFSGCSGLSTLDLSNFDTSSVTNIRSMFFGCSGLSTLDLSNFDTSSVTNMGSMFYNCSRLTSIKVSSTKWSTAKVTNGSRMFNGCISLPNYSISYVDHGYCSRYMTFV